jgi:hypothetical protein
MRAVEALTAVGDRLAPSSHAAPMPTRDVRHGDQNDQAFAMPRETSNAWSDYGIP